MASAFKGKGSQNEDLMENVLSYAFSEDIKTYRMKRMAEVGGPGEPAE